MKCPALASLAGLVLIACSTGPEPVRWGTDACSVCRMVISDRAFVAEFVQTGGKVDKFDGVDELVRFLGPAPPDGTAYVGNGESGDLIPARGAAYLHAPALRAPMGGHVMSFASAEAATTYAGGRKLAAARVLTYDEAVAQLRQDDAHGRR